LGTPFDDQDFDQMKKVVEDARTAGRWVIFVGHEIGPRAHQTTDVQALQALLQYLKDPANGIWLSTVAKVAGYIRKQRGNE
jgi:hypothetical protein